MVNEYKLFYLPCTKKSTQHCSCKKLIMLNEKSYLENKFKTFKPNTNKGVSDQGF